MEDMRFREPLVDQLLYSFPREAVPLAAPPEHAKPEMGDVVPEPCKCATIRRYRMVVEVACNDLLQPLSLFGNWLMHPLSQFLLNLLQLSLHAVPPGLPLDQEVTAPGFAADEGKPQEVEGLRFTKPTPFLRLVAAKRPNSISLVLSGCSDSENSFSRARMISRKRRASASCWNPTMRSSA